MKEKLAYAYKIIAHLQLDDHTYTHLSVRASDGCSYYIYPFGMCFAEVEQDNLMRISLKGEVLEGVEYQYNKTGYVIHGAIYEARSDINAIFHIHTPNIVAASVLPEGLLPISQWALHFYNKIAYHNYNSLALDSSEADELIRNLGEYYVMLMRNHGSITCGKTIEEAMFYTYHLEKSCMVQNLVLANNRDFITPNIEICEKSVHDLLSFEKDLGKRDWEAWVRKIKAKA